MNRFTELDVILKSVPPVYGYYSEKLVPLEKALEPIQSEINELPRYIQVAKKYCHFPSQHGLTHDESASIYIYAMEWGEKSLYRLLNQALRSENHEALNVWFPYLKLFNTALEKLSTAKMTMWKGTISDIGKSFIKNQIVTWRGINSCSALVNVIKDKVGNSKNITLFIIDAANTKRLAGYTEHENEDEIILRMDTQLRVRADALCHENGTYIIHLIEIDDINNKS